jgi:AcrR family transcriptional regulator
VPSSSTASLRDRRRSYTQNEIAGAAIGLFDERGYDQVTVDDIATAVGISTRTFFRYFATKEELMLRESRRVHRRLVRALASRPVEEGPVTALRNAFVESSRVAPDERDLVLRYGRVQVQTPVLNERMIGAQAVANETVVAMVAQRMGVDAETDFRPEAIVLAMTAVASATFRRWVASGGHGTPSESIASAVALLEAGLARLDHAQPGGSEQQTPTQ